MCSSDPPPPPDYAGAAIAQGQANKEAAIAASRLNNPNVVNPYGTQTFTEGATPEARPTVTQTLSPAQQALLDQRVKIQGLLGGLGQSGAESLEGIIGKQLDLSGAPAAPGSAAETRRRVEDAMMARVNEDLADREEQVRANLRESGHSLYDKAGQGEFRRLDRARTDALNQAIIAGGAEASREFGMDTARRKDAIAEILAQRGVPLNEITALMSGSQVTNPFAVPGVAQNAQVAPAPMFAATQAAGQYASDVYNAEQAQRAATLSGLFGIGAGAATGWGAMGFPGFGGGRAGQTYAGLGAQYF